MKDEKSKSWLFPWPKDRIADLVSPGLSLTESIQNRLRSVRNQQMAEHKAGRPQIVCSIFYELEVVTLKVGMGRASFLGLDGRLWIENFGEGMPPEVLTDARKIASEIVRWSGDIGLPELIERLHGRPESAIVCGVCEGNRWFPASIMVGEGGRPLCCLHCQGLGWTLA